MIFLKTPNIISSKQENAQVVLMKLDDFFAFHKVFTFRELANTISDVKHSPVKNSTLY